MSTTLSDKHHKARIAHYCDLCSRRIEPGETYRRVRVVDAGEAWTSWGCEHCEALSVLLGPWLDQGEGISEDDIGEFEPSTIAEARLWIYWKRQWRTRNGDLRPVPRTPDDSGVCQCGHQFYTHSRGHLLDLDAPNAGGCRRCPNCPTYSPAALAA